MQADKIKDKKRELSRDKKLFPTLDFHDLEKFEYL